jgi:hypothetical protein
MDDPEEMRDWARTAIAAARDARREDGRRKTAERPDAKANAIGTARSVSAKPRPLSKNR